MNNKMQIISFTVDDDPYAFWDLDLSEKNIQFLNDIDPEYFIYLSEIHVEHLNGENRQQSALALRISYSHALEVFFALLCSMIQAPNCVVGWMLSYKFYQLQNIVNKINKGREIYTRFKDNCISWDNLSKYVYNYLNYDIVKKQWIISGFSKLWQGFAKDFLNDKFTQEYNGAKHGLRTKSGGVTLSIGPQDQQESTIPKSKMENLGGSEFGTSYFRREKILENNSFNYRPRLQFRNWDPYNFINGLGFLSISINNIIQFLKIINKVDAKECKYITPSEKDFFNAPWVRSVGIIDFDIGTVFKSENIIPITKDEILSSYKN